MASVLTVTLNAAVDKTYTVPGFSVNGIHRPRDMFIIAGGKGINVARAYTALGGSAVATGFVGGKNGKYIQSSLDGEGISNRFVTVEEESRLCIKIVDPEAGSQTELNESGPNISADDCSALLNLIRELLPQFEFLILSGSAPPGISNTIYREITEIAQNEFGVRVVLDASGELLVQGIQSKPFLAKPNHSEVAALGIQPGDWRDCAAMLREQYDLAMSLVTAGAQGAVAASVDGIWQATPPSIMMKSAVGSGDALTAGFLWELGQDRPLEEALRFGVAAGAVNAMSFGAGVITRAQTLELAKSVRVDKIG